MATKNFNDIASDIIDSILIVNPSVDVKIGSVVRDVFVDPQAEQISALYVVADSTAQAQSVLTARNQQLDRLGYNFGQLRNSATRATANIVINIANGIAAPTLLQVGDQFYTNPNQQNVIQTFVNTTTTLLTTGQTQVTLTVVNIQPGAAGNVAANTITNSTYDFATSIYNPEPAIGGTDVESDASFAARIPYVVTGRYINTYNGIVNIINTINNVVGIPNIITPDNIASRGMYTTDVYLRENSSYYGTVIQETAPANVNYYTFQTQPLYENNPINSILLVNPNNNAVNQAVSSDLYQIVQDGSDYQGFYVGSTKAKQKILWLNGPPAVPYIISYNVDQPVIDSQNAFDVYNEITNDVLFKPAPSFSMYVGANLLVQTGTDYTTTYQNASANLINLFNSLDIGQTLTKKDVEQALLQDSNVIDVVLSNLDTTFGISFNIDTTGQYITPLTLNGIPFSQITPFRYYPQIDMYGGSDINPLTYYNIQSSIWIGSPLYINTTANTIWQNSPIFGSGNNPFVANPGGSNVNQNNLGVLDAQTIQGVSATWANPALSFYDQNNNAYIINFSSLPPTAGGTLSFNIVQPTVSTISTISYSANRPVGTLYYLSMGSSLVAPIEKYTGSNSANAYVTYLVNGLTPTMVNVYKNGVPLTPSTTGLVGDFTYLQTDAKTPSANGTPVVNQSSGLINLSFTVPPNSADVLQFGLLNPNISISYGTR